MSTDAPWLLTCVGVTHDLPLLPHFLRHYLALGIAPNRVIVILNAERLDAPGIAAARAILSDAGVTRDPVLWIAPYTSGTMWEKRGEVQSGICAPEDWVLNADVDEFQLWPKPLRDCLRRADALGANCIQGVMIDRLAEGGRLAAVDAAPSIEAQFPIRAEVAQSIGGESRFHGRGGTVKLMASHARMRPRRGGHDVMDVESARYLYGHSLCEFREIDRPDFRFRVPTQVDHVHWTDRLVARLETRLATPGVSPAGAEYGRRQLDHIAAHGGIALDRVALDNAPARADWDRSLAALRRRGRLKRGISTLRGAMRRALGR